MADGKVKLAKCLIDNASEVNVVRKGFLQEDEAKASSTPVQLEGVSGHALMEVNGRQIWRSDW